MMRRFLLILALLIPAATLAQTPSPPVLLYTDIVTGAKTGGEGGNGVYLTIYGKGFGSSRGSSTVTIGGGAVASYKSWCASCDITTLWDMIVVQIGSSAATGNIVVTVNSQASNTLPFTVSAGNIYFVSPSGNDSTGTGSFASPWLTPVHAKNAMVAGDTVYFRAGTYTTIDNDGAIIECNGACSGTATQYQNFLGYPGEYPRLGDADGTSNPYSPSTVRTIYHWGGGTWAYTTFGELVMRGSGEAFTCQNTTDPCNFIRIVGSDVRSVVGGSTALDIEDGADHMSWLGNESAHNCTINGTIVETSCTYDNRAYSAYVGGYGAITNMEIAYNRFHDNPFGKGIQIYGHQAGESLVGLIVHDNLIYNQTMVGIEAGGTDGGSPWVGTVNLYNNVIYNVSTGAGADHANFGCIQLQGINSTDGIWNVFNNTFYNCSPAHNTGGAVPAGGVISFGLNGVNAANIYNNIEYGATGGLYYYYFDDSTSGMGSRMTLSNNLYFNLGTGPSGGNYNVGSLTVPTDTSKVNGDPKFTSTATPNFVLLAGSPAIGAGTATGAPTRDFAQLTRANPPAIGAFDAAGTTTATPTFSPVAGSYGSTQTVTISSATGGATICYTIDGTTPTANGAGTCTHGTTYSTTISVAITTTLKAIASLSGSSDSTVGSATYVIPGTAVGSATFLITLERESLPLEGSLLTRPTLTHSVRRPSLPTELAS